MDEAIRELRRFSPRAVRYLAGVVEDEDEATADRVRAATALLNKIIPDASPGDAARTLGSTGASMLRIEIVDPAGTSEMVTITTPSREPVALRTLDHQPED